MDSLGEVLGAMTLVASSLGGGIAFVWNKVEQQAKIRDAANHARFESIEKKLEECQERETDHQERRGVQLTVIELLWQEVKRLAPDAPVLDRAKRLLDGLISKAKDD